MNELEGDVEKSSATVDSTAIDEALTQRLGCGEGETEGFLAKEDQVEDVMVDVVGSDDVEDDHGRTGVSFDGNTGCELIVEECAREETEARDLDMEEVAVSPKDCETSAGVRVLTSEKAEVMVNQEEVAGSGDDCNAAVGSRVLISEKAEVILNGEGLKRSAEVSFGKVETTVARGSNGDIAVIDGKEQKERGLIKEAVELPVESVQELTGLKIARPSLTTDNLGSQEVDMVVMKEGLAFKDEAEGTDEVDERSKEDGLHPTNKVTTDGSHGNETVESSSREPMECSQEVADGDHVVNEKIGNEVLDSLNISDQSSSLNSGCEDVDVAVVEESLASIEEAQVDIPVNPSLVYSGDRILLTGEGDNKIESSHPTNEVIKNSENGTGLQDSKLAVEPLIEVPQIIGKEVTETGLTNDEEIVKQPTKSIQELSYGIGVMDDEIGKTVDISDSIKIADNLGPEEANGVTHIADVANHAEFSYEDAGVDIDEVFGWKDEVLEIDVITGAEKDQNFNITASTEPDVEQGPQCASSAPVITEHPENNFRSLEADMEQGLESSSEPLQIEHQKENLEAREADVEQGLPESSSDPVQIKRSEENLKPLEADVEQGLLESSNKPVQIEHQEENLRSREADVEQGLPETSSEPVKIEHRVEDLMSREADVDQGLPETSSEPVVIEHREENLTSPKPIVYGRRVHVEVPLYHSPPLDENISPVLDVEILEFETDSEEDDESVQEDEQNVVEQYPELLENVSSFSLHQACYFQPPEIEGEFSVSDLVWGKVRSHPWWPGQIIDPSDASKKAMKYHKKDCFLVAYFGDHTFAWNNSSVLKPFRENFSHIEKQTNLESFKIAVECALEEVTRRVELGLACSCVPQDIYKKIEYQEIDNAGVRKRSSRRPGFDESAGVSSFEPNKLVDYVRLLAQFPNEGDKLELAMAKAQLSSYGRYKGYRELPEFWFSGDLLEDAPVGVGDEQVHKDSEKSRNNLIESSFPKKEITLSDITDDTPESGVGTSRSVSSSGLKKRKARVSISNGSVKRQYRHSNKVSPALISTLKPNKVSPAQISTSKPNKVSPALISTPKPSFRVGEVIQRLASQLTGPTMLLKSNGDKKVEHGQDVDQIVGSPVSLQTPENLQQEASVAEMLSQLHSTAQDPMKDYTFLQTIIPFFYERRAAVFTKSLKKHSTNEKPVDVTKREVPGEQDPEEFEFVFDDLNDSYWTDRIVQNQSEEQLLQDNQNGGTEIQAVAFEQDKPAKRRRRSKKNQSEEQLLQDNQNGGTECQVVAYEQDKPAKRRRRSKKNLNSNNEVEPEEVEEESEVVQRRRQNLATEIVLKFTEGIYFPSEINLNKMFRRFGPLMESETEVDRQGGRARVVFKRCTDAEVAHSSAKNFNIFGSVDVNYELNYTPLVSYKPLPVSLLQDPMDAS